MGRFTTRTGGSSVAAIAVLVASLAWATPARADEPLFGFSYTTDLLPKGKSEIEQWMTWRTQKAHGTFHLLEGRTEFSYGVTDFFQLSGYLNYDWSEAFHDSRDRTTAPPEAFAERSVNFDPDAHFNEAKFVGVSIEGIYRVLSPYTDPFGLALYLEPTFGPGFVELDEKLILQKNFLDDRLVLAFNLSISQELRELPGDKTADPGTIEATRHWDKETDLNWSVGASYRFARGWSAGAEFINEREFSELIFWQGKYATNSAYWVGPTLHYGGKNFFFTATFLEQLPLASDYANHPSPFLYHGRTYADDFERYRLRLKIGYYF
jgi:hypothetical protein